MSEKKFLVIVNGFPNAGKDTFMDFCIKYLHSCDIKAEKFSAVDGVKEAAKLLGWNGEKDEEGRGFLCLLKYIADLKMDFTVNYVDSLMEKDFSVIFLALREPVWIKKVRETFNGLGNNKVLTVLVRGDRENCSFDNSSDREVLEYPYDCMFINNHTQNLEDFEKKAVFFCNNYILKNLEN